MEDSIWAAVTLQRKKNINIQSIYFLLQNPKFYFQL